MDSGPKDLLVDRFLKASDEVGPDAFEAAFWKVFDCSKFRPDIAEIRDVLGLNVDPVIQQAADALAVILASIRVHGVSMQPVLGKIIRERDADGRLLALPERAESTEPPALDEVSARALADFGYGLPSTALSMIAEHPAVDQEGGRLMLRAKQIEDRWLGCYRKALGAK